MGVGVGCYGEGRQTDRKTYYSVNSLQCHLGIMSITAKLMNINEQVINYICGAPLYEKKSLQQTPGNIQIQ